MGIKNLRCDSHAPQHCYVDEVFILCRSRSLSLFGLHLLVLDRIEWLVIPFVSSGRSGPQWLALDSSPKEIHCDHYIEAVRKIEVAIPLGKLDI